MTIEDVRPDTQSAADIVVGTAPPRADVRALFDGCGPGLLMTRDDVGSTLTYSLPGVSAGSSGGRSEPLTVRVPTCLEAVPRVQREARLLVELRRRRLGPIEKTIPRHAGVCQFEGLPGAIASVPPGRPMTVEHDRWVLAVRPDLVRRDFQRASSWLARFQQASSSGAAPATWASEVVEALRDRTEGHPLRDLGMARLDPAALRLDGRVVERTAVHGDFWHGNLLVHEHEVSGVVNWASGEAEGSPLRDLVRFALRYSQHLAQHTFPARRVARDVGLRRAGAARGIPRALLGAGWYPRVVRSYLRDGLCRVGVPPELWYQAALVGLAELAAESCDGQALDELLAALCSLPAPA